MKVVIQRCNKATLKIKDNIYSSIENGLLILLGIGKEDDINDINWLSGKISRLRIFDDDKGIMNLSIKDINGEIMLVSQFTLFASTKKGNRPSYINSAPPEKAIPIYEQFIKQIKLESGCKVATGKFGAHMDIALENNGPVTIVIDSKDRV